MRTGIPVCAVIVMWAGLLISADPVCAANVHIGGSDTATRIIFDLKVPVSPEVSQENRTLIVNFPDTVADPQTLLDQFMIEKLTFDGKQAAIIIREPFTYKVISQGKPPRFIMNLFAIKDLQGTCPLRHIDAVPGKGTMKITFSFGKQNLPKVRTSKSGRIFLQFSGEISCEEIPKLASSIPQLQYMGTLKMQQGTAMSFALAEKNMLLGVRSDDQNAKIILDIGSTGTATAESRYAVARVFSESGDVAGVISTLKPWSRMLTTQEKILLSRAYWSSSYPYRMGRDSAKAVALMNEALKSMTPGMERERVMLEYCSMLIKSGQATQAMDYIRFLTDSAWDDIAMEAAIREVEILNRKSAFQDAYIAYRRLIRDFGQDNIPARLKGSSLSIQGDTYLGLSDYPKALIFYKDALAADPALVRYDPGLPSRMAEAAYNSNDYAQAKGYILQAVNLGNSASRQKNLLMLGDCLYQLGEKEKAIVVFSQVENIARKNDSGVIARLKVARIMLERDTDERGRVSDKTFNKVMDIYEGLKSTEDYHDPSLASLVKIRIAQAYAKHGDWDKSLEAYQKVWLETKNSDPIHHYAQAEAAKTISQQINLLYKESRYNQIYDLYTRYQGSFMKEFVDPEILFIIGSVLDQTGHKSMARSVLASSVKDVSSSREQALALLTTIDAKTGNYSEALKWNTLYLNAYPDGKDAPLMRDKRGEILYLSGNFKDALPYLEVTAGKGGQTALTPLSYLSDTYRRLSMSEQEIATLEKIISYHGTITSPVIGEALYQRGNQLRRSGNLDRAKLLYRELLDAYPRSTHAYWVMYHLAHVEAALGEYTQARGLLTNINRLSTDPILLSAARTAANDMDLKSEMEGYGFLKERSRGE